MREFLKRRHVTEPDSVRQERRKHRRFSVALDLRYHLARGRSGTGRLVNMSRGGLLFRSGEQLPPGELVELEIDWAFLSAGPLHLSIHGFVLRSDDAGTAVSISKYEFRRAAEPPAEPTGG